MQYRLVIKSLAVLKVEKVKCLKIARFQLKENIMLQRRSTTRLKTKKLILRKSIPHLKVMFKPLMGKEDMS